MLHVIRRIHSINGRNSMVNQLLLTKNVRTASSVPTKKVETKTSPEETKTEDLDEKFLKVFHYPHVIKVALYQRLKVIITKSFNSNRYVQSQYTVLKRKTQEYLSKYKEREKSVIKTAQWMTIFTVLRLPKLHENCLGTA